MKILWGYLFIAFCCYSCGQQVSSSNEESFLVKEYYGEYDVEQKIFGKPAGSLGSAISTQWKFPDPKPENANYKVGILFPNDTLNDPAWGSVWHGIDRESKRLGLPIVFAATESYDSLEQHRRQLLELASRGDLDLIVLGAIDYRRMDNHIQMVTDSLKIPIIELINDVYAPSVSAKVMIASYQNGFEAGEYLKKHAKKLGKDELVVAMFPGPKSVGWFAETVFGFADSMRDFPGEIQILPPVWGATQPDVQRKLVVNSLKNYRMVDYIVANGVAAVEVVEVLEKMGNKEDTYVISTYYSPGVDQYLTSGEILMAPDIQLDKIGVTAVDVALRYLDTPPSDREKLPFLTAPEILVRAKERL